MNGPREEVGGDRWPGLTLKITSSIGNKQLSSTTIPENVGPPLEPKSTVFFDPTVNKLRMLNPL